MGNCCCLLYAVLQDGSQVHVQSVGGVRGLTHMCPLKFWEVLTHRLHAGPLLNSLGRISI
jgi:hypothetical protein